MAYTNVMAKIISRSRSLGRPRNGCNRSSGLIHEGADGAALGNGIVLNGGIGKRLLNVKEAAEYQALDVDTVYKKARLREFPSVKVGRALRFDVVKLNRYIEQQTIETVD